MSKPLPSRFYQFSQSIIFLLLLISNYGFGQEGISIAPDCEEPEKIDEFPVPPNFQGIENKSGNSTWSVNTSYGGTCSSGNSCGGSFDCCIPAPCTDYKIPVVITLLLNDACGNHTLTAAQINTFFTNINAQYDCFGLPFELVKCENWDDSAVNYGGLTNGLFGGDAAVRTICDNDMNLFYRSPANDVPPNDPSGDGVDDYIEARAYNIPNVMNMYIPGNYNGFTGMGFTSEGGVASFPSTSLASFGMAYGIDGFNNTGTNCSGGSITNGSTVVAHEVGHWFGLYHTHGKTNDGNGATDNECPDGSNCCTEGDNICDTEADPNLTPSGCATNNGNCTWDASGCPTPPCGVAFGNALPIGTNIMSYGRGACSTEEFSQCQLAKMVDALLCARGPLLCCRDEAEEFAGGNGPHLEICVDDPIPTFMASSSCYAWYDGLGASANQLATGMSFTPTATQVDVTCPGVYTMYLGDVDEFNPDCRTEITVTVLAEPGSGTGNAMTSLNLCGANTNIALTTDVTKLGENCEVGWWITETNPISTTVTNNTTLTTALGGATIGGPISNTVNHIIQSTGGTPVKDLTLPFDCTTLNNGITYFATPIVAKSRPSQPAVTCMQTENSSPINVNFGPGDLRAGAITGLADLSMASPACPTNQGAPISWQVCIDIVTYTNGSGNIRLNLRQDICNNSGFVLNDTQTGVTAGSQLCYNVSNIPGFDPLTNSICVLIWDDVPNSSANNVTLVVDITVSATYAAIPAIVFPGLTDYNDCLFGAPVQISCSCGTCPIAIAVTDDTGATCDGGGTDDYTNWKTSISTTNPLNATQDPSGLGSIVYSSTTPSAPGSPPTGDAHMTGVHSGVDNCVSETQTVMAYLYCDADNSGTVTAGDTYTLISTYTLTVFPEVQAPTQMTAGCANTLTVGCTGDVMGPSSNPTGGASNSNWNFVTGVYTAQPGDAAGTIVISISSKFNGMTGACPDKNFLINTPACPFNCPSANTVANDTGATCDGGGTDDYATWKTSISTANPLNTTQDPGGLGMIVYSSTTPVAPVTPPTGDGHMTGIHSGANICNTELQTVMAYLYCDVDDSGTVNAGDTYTLISTYTLTIFPDVQTPMQASSGCINMVTVGCAGDVLGSAFSPTGGASIANWDPITGTYTAQPGDAAGSIMVSISSGISGTPCPPQNFIITTPACSFTCPGPVPVTLGAGEVCSGNGTDDLATWQASVLAANPSTAIGMVVYSSVIPMIPSAPHDNILPNGNHSNLPSCSSATQTARAYYWCDFDNSGTVTFGDTYTLISTYVLTVYPIIQTPSVSTSGCVVTVTGACPNDIITLSGQTVVGGIITNNGTNSVTYTAAPGDLAGIVTINVSSGVSGSVCTFPSTTIATPACPSCMLSVTCPTFNNLGTFDCNSLNAIPAIPTNPSMASMGLYNISIINPCGNLVVSGADDIAPDACTTTSQTITRTITILDDLDNDGMQDPGETVETCTYFYTIIPVSLGVACPAPLVLNNPAVKLFREEYSTGWGCFSTVTPGTSIKMTVPPIVICDKDQDVRVRFQILRSDNFGTCSGKVALSLNGLPSTDLETLLGPPTLGPLTNSCGTSGGFNTYSTISCTPTNSYVEWTIPYMTYESLFTNGMGTPGCAYVTAESFGVSCNSCFGDELTMSVEWNEVRCLTSSEITIFYNSWLAQFNHSLGCNPVVTSTPPSLPPYVCGGPINLTYNYTVVDDCNQSPPVSCTSTFELEQASPVTAICPAAVNLPACVSELDIINAYFNWVESFEATGGCPCWNSPDPPPLPPYVCGAAVNLTYNFLIEDLCGNTDMCTSTFNVAGASPVTINCPPPVNLLSCASQADIQNEYNIWMSGFEVNGGCNTTSNIGAIPSLPPFVCGAPVTLSFSLEAMDDCDPTPKTCFSFFEVAARVPLAVVCPTPVTLPSCSSQSDIQNAYNTWVAGFEVNDGCNATSNIANIPPLPAYMCGAGINLSFQLEATDECIAPIGVTCSSTFEVLDVANSSVTCPLPVILSACSDQTVIQAAYNAWVAGFMANGGCNTTTNIGNIPQLPPYACGAPINLTFTFMAMDDCTPPASFPTCTSTFEVLAAGNVVVTCPAPVTLPECSSDADIQNAYNAWIAGFIVSGGCNTTTNSGNIPALPLYICGAGVSLSFTFAATDDCTPASNPSCTSTFEVLGSFPLNIDCPPPVNLPACSSEADILTAYFDWLTGFDATGGCNVITNIGNVPAPPTYICGQAVNFDFIFEVTDDCNTTPMVCFSSFNVDPVLPLMVNCPTPVVLNACASQSVITSAYNLWVGNFTFVNGCNPMATIPPPALPPYVCGDAVSLIYEYTVVDDCGNTEMCTSTFEVPAATPPMAVCNNYAVFLDPQDGVYFLDPFEIDIIGAGSSSNCDLTLNVFPQFFDCTMVGPFPVTLTVTDDCGNTDDCIAIIDVFASQFCIDNFPPFFANFDGPMISDPCVCRGNGEFDEEVHVESNSTGQMWSVSAVNGLTPWSVGDLLTDNSDNSYSAVGIHLDGIGFNIEVQSPFWPGLTLGIGNVCHYPDVEFTTDLSVLCLGTDPITLEGNGGEKSDGTLVDGTSEFKINGTVTTELDPTTLGIGSHTVEFCFDAGDALGFTQILSPGGGPPIIPGPPVGANTLQEAQDDPGCEVCVTQTFNILETPDEVACNNAIQVSLDADCETLILPDMVLEGSYACFDDYIVSLTRNGQPVANPVSGSNIGQTLTATVTHVQSGNSCWGSITVEDKLGPEFVCSVDLLNKAGVVIQSDDTIRINCSVDPATVPDPLAIDNCDPSPFVVKTNETTVGGNCDVITITRTYSTTDIYGNQGNTCSITIIVDPVMIEFPDDVTWTCEQYAAFANVVDATATHPLIIANAASMDQSLLCCITGADGDDVVGVDPYTGVNYWMDGEDLDVTLDPLYNDDIDNPITDGNAACGNATVQTDEDDCIANFGYLFGCPYLQDCDIAPPTAHAPQIIQVPIYQPPFAPTPYPSNHPIRGLEDADVLALTGSGQPNVVGANCNWAVTHHDQRIEACEGFGTDGDVFKILRTWTALNWCTGATFTDIQVIKVLDRKAPTITFGDSYNDELVSNVPSDGPHPDCRSNGLIDVPTFADNCTGVTSIRVLTPFGEATSVENNGQIVGFRVPAPYLPKGDHTITYVIEDGCGNSTTADREITVIDGIPPVPICREVTQVALSGTTDGVTAVQAKFFDEGSYDYCSSVYFKVKRMERFSCDKANVDTNGEEADPTRTNDDQEWFDDNVKFCCEDIGDTVIVILRVYDTDPGPGEINTNASAANGFTHRNGTRNGIAYNDAFLNGTYNDCMIEVLLEDKVRPTCVPPQDVWINCNDLPDNVDYTDTDQLNDLFGAAIADDNCNATIEELNPNIQVDLCGVGQIIRTFRAEDDGGNRSLGRCSQTVMIMAQNSYKLLVPGDFEEECDVASPRDFEFEEYACDLIAINSEDSEFPVSPNGECKKIIRTWTLINWCEYDGASPAQVLPRLDLNLDGEAGDGEGGSNNPVTGVRHAANHMWVSNGDIMILNDNPNVTASSSGYYTYVQHIKIFDSMAPDVSYTGDTEFCGGDLDNDPCDGQVDIAPTIDDLCTATSHRWELSAFATSFGSADFSGNGDLSGRFPLGVHTVRFYVEDECGNISHFDVTFEVVDCKQPTPVCHNGLSIDIMPVAKMVELWAVDFDASSFDYCTDADDLRFRVNRVTDRNNDGVITPDDYITNVPPHDSVQFVCSDVGQLVNIQFWVGDAAGNWDFCVTYIDVQDNNNACVGSKPLAISGKAKTETGVPTANVEVTLSGGMNANMMTANDGAFAFNNLIEGNDYSITPMRNDDIRNGVSTYDLALISKHVLSVELLNSPYKWIAADANRSGTISTLDLVAIRKVILFVANEFPNNNSWRFVDNNQILNPANPLGAPIIEVANFNNLLTDQVADFVAVKIGDVSGDAEPQNLNNVDDRTFDGTFFFNTEEQIFEAGDRIEALFTGDLTKVMGYQFTMSFDRKVLDLIEIQEATATQQNFGQMMVNDGILTASWNGEATSDRAFKLIFEAKNSGRLSETIDVNSAYTKAEAYAKSGAIQSVGIDFGTTTKVTEFALHQNIPNPFTGETMIGFELPNAAAVVLIITDISGKEIKSMKGEFAKGYNSITLQSEDFPNGVLNYQIITDGYQATRQMVVIK